MQTFVPLFSIPLRAYLDSCFFNSKTAFPPNRRNILYVMETGLRRIMSM